MMMIMMGVMSSRHLMERASHAVTPREGGNKYTATRSGRWPLPPAPVFVCDLAPPYIRGDAVTTPIFSLKLGSGRVTMLSAEAANMSQSKRFVSVVNGTL